jgi:hypothetical protein
VLARIAIPIVMIVLGAIAAIAIPGMAGTVVAMVLVGSALVIAVCLVFLEVGLSEDRERARQEGRRPRG